MRGFIYEFAGIIILALAIPHTVSGQVLDPKQLHFVITATKKKLEAENSVTTSERFSTEKWAYVVNIQNSTFADQADLTVNYEIFMRDDSAKRSEVAAQQPLRKEAGSETVATLGNGKTFTFTTKDMTLKSASLKGGWVHEDGSKREVKDSLYGVWVRILKGDQIVTEFCTPPTLKTKTTW